LFDLISLFCTRLGRHSKRPGWVQLPILGCGSLTLLSPIFFFWVGGGWRTEQETKGGGGGGEEGKEGAGP
jgi:hypothetical protein